MSGEWVIQVQENESLSYSLQGNGEKNLWIICSSEDLTPENEAQLRAIIQAIKYDPEKDCFIIKISKKVQLATILDENTDHVIVFGILPEVIGFNIDMEWYVPVLFEKFTVIFSESLEALSRDKVKKGRLWTTLKKIFLEK